MRWDREPWRKLYMREPLDQQVWPVLTRSFRDFLLRHAEDDGTLFRSTTDPGGDLCDALKAKDNERDIILDIVRTLLSDRYLEHRTDGRLLIRNLPDAQERRSREAIRKKAERNKKRAAIESDINRTSLRTQPRTEADEESGQNTGSDQIRKKEEKEEKERAHDSTLSPEPKSGTQTRATIGQDAIALAERIRSLPALSAADPDRLGEAVVGQMGSTGRRIEWVLAAICKAAAELAGVQGLTREATNRKVLAFTRVANAKDLPAQEAAERRQPKPPVEPTMTKAESEARVEELRARRLAIQTTRPEVA